MTATDDLLARADRPAYPQSYDGMLVAELRAEVERLQAELALRDDLLDKKQTRILELQAEVGDIPTEGP